MAISKIPQGQMFIHFAPTYMDKPRVWVKVEDGNEEPSLFIENSAMVRFSINPNSKPTLTERWLIGDRYYNEMVNKGEFIPITDLNEVDSITEKRGWPAYEIEFDF